MTIALLFLAGVLVGVMAGFPLGILLEQHQNKDYRPRLLAGKVVSFKQTDMVVTDITYQYGGGTTVTASLQDKKSWERDHRINA